MNRFSLALTLGVAITITAQAATYTVGFQKTLSISVPGATAAYTVDPLIAEASADQGVVALMGKSPGTTHLIVVTPDGVQTLEVVVPMPAPIYPRGWVTPRPEGLSNETGYVETRYSSLPAQLTNVLDFSRQGRDMSTDFYLATTDFLPSANNQFASYSQSKFAISSLSYTIQTKRLNVTLFDQLVDESPLTLSGAVIRGLHWQEGNWFFHEGYTSPFPFAGLFLPIRPEGEFGAGYRYQLSKHSSLVPSFYYLTMPAAVHTGNSGAILSVQYLYQPSDSLHFAAEIGESRGFGGSSSLTYKRRAENLRVRFRYTPEKFAALSISNFRGLYSDVAWTRQWSERLGTDLNFTADRFNLTSFNEVSVNGGLQLRYRPLKRWTLFGGTTYSLFRTEGADQAPLEGIYYPEGAGFNSRHFGATFQHQWSRFTEQNSGGHQYLASAHIGFGHFSFSGYAERETQAPTVGFLLSQVTGLGPLLSQSGVTATTPQQISDFLNQNAALINLQYLNNVTINLTPVREQVSGSATWQGHGSAPQIDYEYLRNIDHEVTSTNDVAIHRVSVTQRLGLSNDLSLTVAEYRTRSTGQPLVVSPLISLSLKHHFNTAPSLLVLERHGTIKGRVFEDLDGQGVHSPSAPGVAGVEVILDNRRRARTSPDGSYHFPGVPEGKHDIQAILHGDTAYYFTTPEQVETSENSEVNFGVARSLSSLGGEVLDDIPHGVPGIVVVVRGEKRRTTVVSAGDGKFLLPKLADGEYSVSVDGDSLPAGYVVEEPAEVRVVTASGKAPRATLRIRALRNVSGRVLVYDRALGQYVGARNLAVILKELSLRTTTDAEGRFLFRELRSGTFVVSAEYQGQTVDRQVTVPEQPAQLTDINLVVGQR
ncbi:MAG: SdrD B-like domain-containing protein [Bryobacteraceae bacterium]